MKNFTVFYQNQMMTLSEAGALAMREMIEKDLPRTKHLPNGWDPYKWLAQHLRKSDTVIRRWTYDWESSSGAMPTIDSFFEIARLTNSKRILHFTENIIGNPIEQADLFGNRITGMASIFRGFADQLEIMAGALKEPDKKPVKTGKR